jgi:hypothetical protein
VPDNVYRPRVKLLAEAATVPGPASIAELARALQNDVDLIYEWVYSNVSYYCLWNSNRGALGTLIDGIGGPFDQANFDGHIAASSGL